MGALDVNAVVGTEMERVTPLVEGLYEKDDTFYSSVDVDSNVETVSNRDMRVPIMLRPGGYFRQFNPNGGDLGLGGAPYFDKAVIGTVSLSYACQWTKSSEWGTDDKRKAVINAFNKIMSEAMPQFRHDSDALCMTSGNGVLGTVTSVSTAAGVDTVTMSTDGFGVMLLRFGLKVNVYDATMTTQRTVAFEPEITYYDIPNKQIKLTPAVPGITATDVIVLSGLSGASPTSILGVPYHNSASSVGTWLGFDRSTTPEIRATRVNASGALALPFPRLVMNKMMDRLGMSKAKTLKLKAWTNPCQMQAYESLGQLVTIIQKQAKSEDLNLYFGDNMQFAGAPANPSVHWDKKRIDFLASDLWGRAQMHPAKFYESGGRKIFELRGPSGGVATSEVFYITASWNLFEKNPAGGGYIDNLTVPSGY